MKSSSSRRAITSGCWADPEEKRSAIAELGARPVEELAEVARDAEAVVVCVFTDEQVRQVSLDDGLLDAMPAGSVLVLHTTGSPRTAEALAERGRLAGSPSSTHRSAADRTTSPRGR